MRVHILELTLGSMEAHLLCFGSLEALIVILTSGLATAANLPPGAKKTIFCDQHHKVDVVLTRIRQAVKFAIHAPFPSTSRASFALIAHIFA